MTIRSVRPWLCATALTAILAVPFIAGCTPSDPPAVETEKSTAIEEVTSSETPVTEAGTSTLETDSETIVETEAVTEVQTDPAPANELKLDSSLPLDEFAKLYRLETEYVIDDEAGEVLHLTSESKASPALTLQYDRYVSAHNLTPISPKELKYILVKVKRDNLSVNHMHLTLGTDTLRSSQFNPIAATYNGTQDGWQYVIFDLSRLDWQGSTVLKQLAFEYTAGQNAPGQSIYFASVLLVTSMDQVMTITGNDHLTLGYGSGITVTENDPVTYGPLPAPAEDASVKVWFDHITENYAITDTASTGREGYTIRLAQNDISGCQFILAPETDRSFRVEVGTLTHESGATLDTSLYFGYYTNVRGTMQVDAIPPVQEGMTFPVKGGESQAFVIKAKSTHEATAGLYETEVKVYDNATNQCVKMAKVCAYVWDFALSDESEMTVSGWLQGEFLGYAYEGTGADVKTLYKNYYDFLLENRFVAFNLPYDPVTEFEQAKAYLDNPRVTMFELPNKRDAHYHVTAYNEIFKDNPLWRDKVIFYYYDEPHTPEFCGEVAGWKNIMSDYFPTCRWLCPYFQNYDMTMIDGNPDLTAYFSAVMGIWCNKIDAYTPREVNFVPGTSYLQTIARDNQYGEFADRMKTEAEGGDWIWTYFCWEPNRPYANWMADGNGCEPVITSWQCYQNGITGQLMWWLNEWRMDYKNPYDNITSTFLGDRAWGDGIFIYPGVKFGMDTPVASIRLDRVREGVEDYQMLTMLEDLVGKEKVDELVILVTNTVINFTDDDDYLNAVRVMLGDMVEEALKEQ